jgi:hypothetical protein
MKARILILGAAAMALAPGLASAQTAPGNGQNNGQGYNHDNSGNANGQKNNDCEALGTTRQLGRFTGWRLAVRRRREQWRVALRRVAAAEFTKLGEWVPVRQCLREPAAARVGLSQQGRSVPCVAGPDQ